MHAPRFSALVAMAQFAAIGLTATVDSPALATRSDYCANAPETVAGTLLDRRNIESENLTSDSDAHDDTAPKNLISRAGPQNVLWCAPGTQTYILISIASTIDAEDSMATTLQNILNDASAAIFDHVIAVGDGPIYGGKFQWPLGEFSLSQMLFLKIWNANNHQITYGVLHATIAAISSFMIVKGWGFGHFDIYDGGVRVGYGLFT